MANLFFAFSSPLVHIYLPPYARTVVSGVVVRSSSVPTIKSMSSEKRRLVIALGLIEIVLLKLSSTSSMICSRHKLNNTGDKKHHWRTPTDVRNN